MKRAVVVAALIICMPHSAFAVPFDVIVPLNAQIDTFSSVSPIQTPSWGWIVATDPLGISSTDLTTAVFTTVSVTDTNGNPISGVTFSQQQFNPRTSPPQDLLQNQVAGLLSTENAAYNDPNNPNNNPSPLYSPPETLVDVWSWSIVLGFPMVNYSNTVILTAEVSIGTGNDVATYTSFLEYGSFPSSFFVISGQRVSSGGEVPIPEPGTLLLIGSGLVGLGVGAWRRKKP